MIRCVLAMFYYNMKLVTVSDILHKEVLILWVLKKKSYIPCWYSNHFHVNDELATRRQRRCRLLIKLLLLLKLRSPRVPRSFIMRTQVLPPCFVRKHQLLPWSVHLFPFTLCPSLLLFSASFSTYVDNFMENHLSFQRTFCT